MKQLRPRPRDVKPKPPRFAPVAAPPLAPGLCRGCRKPVPPGRRTWCSDGCVAEYVATRSSSGLRRLVFKRDVGVCAACRLDCTHLANQLRSWRRSSTCKAFAREARVKLGVTHRKTLWDADHILPVASGGGSCSLDNIQTLCLWCHKNKNSYQRQQGSATGWTLPTGREFVDLMMRGFRAAAAEARRSAPPAPA